MFILFVQSGVTSGKLLYPLEKDVLSIPVPALTMNKKYIIGNVKAPTVYSMTISSGEIILLFVPAVARRRLR